MSFLTAGPRHREDQGGHVCVLTPVVVSPVTREEREKDAVAAGRGRLSVMAESYPSPFAFTPATVWV